jgi:hypothetical protein
MALPRLNRRLDKSLLHLEGDDEPLGFASVAIIDTINLGKGRGTFT